MLEFDHNQNAPDLNSELSDVFECANTAFGYGLGCGDFAGLEAAIRCKRDLISTILPATRVRRMPRNANRAVFLQRPVAKAR